MRCVRRERGKLVVEAVKYLLSAYDFAGEVPGVTMQNGIGGFSSLMSFFPLYTCNTLD